MLNKEQTVAIEKTVLKQMKELYPDNSSTGELAGVISAIATKAALLTIVEYEKIQNS